MAAPHDRAARHIASRYDGNYDPKRSPDVRAKDRVVEVKTYAGEIPTALAQLGRSSKKQYVALPAAEKGPARDHLEGTGVGLMNWKGDIIKRARRS